MKCSACAADISPGLQFCGYCGSAVADVCSRCGMVNPPAFRFCGKCGAALTQSGSLSGSPRRGNADPDDHAPGAWASGRGERRHVTVLFSDLVGSLRISSQLDPEELHDLILAYRRVCADVVERFDGYVAQYLGDGILAYFGYPVAHEDDAELAVRAGLGIVDAVERLVPIRAGVQLAVRVGIATGLVVAPTDVAAGEDSVVIGETPNIAARLQELAPPNVVLIGAETQRLLGNRVVCEDLGAHALKGAARPVQVWRVVRLDEGLSRFEAVRRRGMTPLVDREEEIEILSRRWGQAMGGQGQVVLLSGEAGIGKSRIAEVLRERVAVDSAAVTRLQCSPHYANSALHPVVRRLEQVLEFDREDPAERRLEKIEALLERTELPVEQVAPLLAALLSVPAGDRYPPLQVGPQRQREDTLAALQSLLLGLATRTPVLLIVEDAHWIDPTSQELLDLLAERVSDVRALVLVTFRPGYWPTWAGSSHVTVCVLKRLGRGDTAEIIGLLAGGKALPDPVREAIVTRTDGIPLFIEEVTKAVLESGALEEQDGRYALSGPLPPRLVPATLQDSLMARLDQASALKAVAQIGSVIGRQFSYELLAAAADLPENELQAALAQLKRAELVFRRGMPPNATYTFKHALVQEAAYESLLFARRRVLHTRVLETLEAKRADIVNSNPELLAHHAAAAGLYEKAVHYRHLAGIRASERSANVEAIAHLTTGLDLLSRLGDSRERRQQELALRIALGPVLITARGPRTAKVAENYTKTRELCAELPESPLHLAALWGTWRVSENWRTKRDVAYSLSAVAERLGDPGLRLQAHHCLWATLFHLGQHDACCEHAAKGLQIYGEGDYQTHSLSYAGHDPKVCALGERALSLWLLGFPQRSLEAIREAMAWAQTLAHAGSMAHGMDYRLMVHRYRRDVPVVRRYAEEMMAFGEKHDLPVQQAKGKVFLGWAIAEEGQLEQGLALMHEGLEVQKAIDTREDFPVFFEMLAGAYARCGRRDLAQDLLAEILEETERTDLCYWTPELYRVRGEALLSMTTSGEDESEGWLTRAADLAREQQAKSLELRAAISLARLETRRSRPDRAQTLLAPVCAWFHEGFDTVDLIEAKRLLDRLQPARS
jgi:class 3 adenylate cyclase/predicted ATPase